jgi:hypothetical protein
MTKIPNSRRNLDLALERLHGRGRKAQQARTSMANAIVGQLLPRGVVKGGSALRLRYGYANTRFTTDLDAARDEDLEIFIDELAASLESGWNGFTGTITEREARASHGRTGRLRHAALRHQARLQRQAMGNGATGDRS